MEENAEVEAYLMDEIRKARIALDIMRTEETILLERVMALAIGTASPVSPRLVLPPLTEPLTSCGGVVQPLAPSPLPLRAMNVCTVGARGSGDSSSDRGAAVHLSPLLTAATACARTPPTAVKPAEVVWSPAHEVVPSKSPTNVHDTLLTTSTDELIRLAEQALRRPR